MVDPPPLQRRCLKSLGVSKKVEGVTKKVVGVPTPPVVAPLDYAMDILFVCHVRFPRLVYNLRPQQGSSSESSAYLHRKFTKSPFSAFPSYVLTNAFTLFCSSSKPRPMENKLRNYVHITVPHTRQLQQFHISQT